MKAAFERQTEVEGASELFKAEEACDLIIFPGIMNLAPSLTGRDAPGVTDPDAQNCVVLGPPKDHQETPAQVALGMVPFTSNKHRTGVHVSPIRQERQPDSHGFKTRPAPSVTRMALDMSLNLSGTQLSFLGNGNALKGTWKDP